MQAAAFPDDEAERVAMLHSLCVLDSAPVEELDRITRLVMRYFNVPMALVSLIDQERQWFKSKQGLAATETPREISFCGHAILALDTFIVPDALQDPRFADNPLVLGAPFIRFYAGQPIRSRSGYALGTLCVIDVQPREFSAEDIAVLNDFARMVENYFHSLESASRVMSVERYLEQSEAVFERVFAQAAVGIAIISPEGQWLRVNQSLCTIVGYSEAELRTKTFQQITVPEDIDDDLALIAQLISGAIATYTLEKRYLHRDGGIVWVELTVSLMRDAAGQPLQFISVISDIHARKQAEFSLAELRHSLELRVEQRTAEMSVAITQLNHQIEKRVAVQRELLAEKERFRTTLENAADAFIEIDRNGLVLAWNRAAEQIFGWSRKEAIGTQVAEKIVPPALRSAQSIGFDCYLHDDLAKVVGHRIQIMACRKDGSEFAAELTLNENHVGDLQLLDAFVQDVSLREANKKEVLENRALLKAITDHLPALISYVDTDLHYRFNNRAYFDWFGLSSAALKDMQMVDLLNESTRAYVEPYIARALAGEQVAFDSTLNSTRGIIQVHVDLVPNIADDGQVTGIYIQAQDISERKLLEQQLAFEASHDQLTGLPNRRAFMAALDFAIARAKRSQQQIALLFLDLDGFKQLNDVYGHEFGDRVLQSFAAILSEAVREIDTVSRLAGDEFTIILEGLNEGDGGAVRVAQKILRRLSVPLIIDGSSVQLACSIGIALVSADELLAADTLLAKADAAMYRAKAAGKACYALN